MTQMSLFDERIDRTPTEASKWHTFDGDVLPLGVADMDFRAPAPVIELLRRRVEHGVFGYPQEPPELRPVVVERLKRLYDWDVAPEALLFVPGVVPAFNVASQAIGQPGDGILAQTPVYGPIIQAPALAERQLQAMPLDLGADGRYTIDLQRMAATITPSTRLFLLCNPHNPVGRVFTRAELEGMAELCLRHNLVVCSDEIHCDLIFRGQRHIPIASLSSEIAARTITLMAPSKTFNIAGLHTAVAIIPNPELRQQFNAGRRGILSSVTIMGYLAALAAYRDGQAWLDEALAYLEGNRELVFDAVNRRMPGLRMARPEGTYLAWLDCRQAALGPDPYTFFLQRARVGLSSGPWFGAGGEGFVRLNFGCCRDLLQEALERMVAALG